MGFKPQEIPDNKLNQFNVCKNKTSHGLFLNYKIQKWPTLPFLCPFSRDNDIYHLVIMRKQISLCTLLHNLVEIFYFVL